MMPSPLRGSCLCNVVRFELTGPFPLLYQCHCSLCRKQGGSVSNTGLIAAADRFRWLSGEEAIGTWQKESGFRSHFCTRCGSPVPNMLRDTGYVWIPSGLLDGDAPLKIGAQVYVDSRASWAQLPTGMPRFETVPGLDGLIELLHAGIQPSR